MSTIVIKMSELPSAYQGEMGKLRRAMQKGARAAAMKLKAYLVDQVDERGITYMGTLKNSFEVHGNSVTNVAPHFAFIELGTRPHKVSMEGVEAIERWVRVKLLHQPDETWADKKAKAEGTDINALSSLLGVPSVGDEIKKITWAIVKKIEREGTKPHYLMRDALPKAAEYFKQEFERILAEESHGGALRKESWEGLRNDAEMRGSGIDSLNKDKK